MSLAIYTRSIGATPPDPKAARAALVAKLAIVMGPAQAEQAIQDLELTVVKAADGAVRPLVIKAVVGVAAISLFFFLLRFWARK